MATIDATRGTIESLGSQEHSAAAEQQLQEQQEGGAMDADQPGAQSTEKGDEPAATADEHQQALCAEVEQGAPAEQHPELHAITADSAQHSSQELEELQPQTQEAALAQESMEQGQPGSEQPEGQGELYDRQTEDLEQPPSETLEQPDAAEGQVAGEDAMEEDTRAAEGDDEVAIGAANGYAETMAVEEGTPAGDQPQLERDGQAAAEGAATLDSHPPANEPSGDAVPTPSTKQPLDSSDKPTAKPEAKASHARDRSRSPAPGRKDSTAKQPATRSASAKADDGKPPRDQKDSQRDRERERDRELRDRGRDRFRPGGARPGTGDKRGGGGRDPPLRGRDPPMDSRGGRGPPSSHGAISSMRRAVSPPRASRRLSPQRPNPPRGRHDPVVESRGRRTPPPPVRALSPRGRPGHPMDRRAEDYERDRRANASYGPSPRELAAERDRRGPPSPMRRQAAEPWSRDERDIQLARPAPRGAEWPQTEWEERGRAGYTERDRHLGPPGSRGGARPRSRTPPGAQSLLAPRGGYPDARAFPGEELRGQGGRYASPPRGYPMEPRMEDQRFPHPPSRGEPVPLWQDNLGDGRAIAPPEIGSRGGRGRSPPPYYGQPEHDPRGGPVYAQGPRGRSRSPAGYPPGYPQAPISSAPPGYGPPRGIDPRDLRGEPRADPRGIDPRDHRGDPRGEPRLLPPSGRGRSPEPAPAWGRGGPQGWPVEGPPGRQGGRSPPLPPSADPYGRGGPDPRDVRQFREGPDPRGPDPRDVSYSRGPPVPDPRDVSYGRGPEISRRGPDGRGVPDLRGPDPRDLPYGRGPEVMEGGHGAEWEGGYGRGGPPPDARGGPDLRGGPDPRDRRGYEEPARGGPGYDLGGGGSRGAPHPGPVRGGPWPPREHDVVQEVHMGDPHRMGAGPQGPGRAPEMLPRGGSAAYSTQPEPIRGAAYSQLPSPTAMMPPSLPLGAAAPSAWGGGMGAVSQQQLPLGGMGARVAPAVNISAVPNRIQQQVPLQQHSAPVPYAGGAAPGGVALSRGGGGPTPLPAADDLAYFYIDPAGQQQGPCSAKQFYSWVSTMSTRPDLAAQLRQFKEAMVWLQADGRRRPLQELLALYNYAT